MTSDFGPWNDYEFVSPKGARLKQIIQEETKEEIE
jgi:hypothetical protein